MSQIVLTEYYPLVLTPQQLTEAMDVSAGASMIIKKVLLQKADTKNRNGRIYPKSILERVLNEYNNTFVKTRRALGELDHPMPVPGQESAGMTVNLKNASHLITELWWEGDDVYGNIEILAEGEFPSGRIAGGLLRKKIPIGVSSRALGSTTDTQDAIIVNDDLVFSCFDIVSYESTIGSTLNLNEAYNIANKKYEEIDSIIYDIICHNSHNTLK